MLWYHRLFVLLSSVTSVALSGHRPIIGVLTTPFNDDPNFTGSSLHSLYADWIYQGGARVAPIPYDLSTSKLDQLLRSINGVLFTGGNLTLGFDTHYVKTAKYILDTVLKLNQQEQIYFPLWGTCMGFQLINALIADNDSVITHGIYQTAGVSLPLEFTIDALSSRMMADASLETLTNLKKSPITSNLHVDGVSPDAYIESKKLSQFFRIISLNHDSQGNVFISTIEGKNVPIYAVQWHPERPQYDWNTQVEIPHQKIAIAAMQHFSNFLIDEARKNHQSFDSVQEEQSALLFNFAAKFLGNNEVWYYFPPQLQ